MASALLGARAALSKALPSKAKLVGIQAGHFRGAIYTNRDWKPGPYPKTEDERRAAAKKYNMLYEDYKPYPEDHVNHMGDYPMLPPIGLESKDPFGHYDFPTLKRNYGDPVHHDFEFYIRERWDITRARRFSLSTMVISFLTAFLGSIGFHLFSINNEGFIWKMSPVPATKQYPKEGIVHYTFEPAD
ncbi:NADH-ubiquinone oxidoreductase ashi subunit-like [Tropilaelaps mercedesae]|uniref:NADH-ubiquinone oxidoreductase ashi subunit-like n=1 Tax=Tropilaelaps mercedesae TaxID=418985 RepID=A0A1V9XX53_9ACAR|nr:NADH-ubiquinone oxidoreductase ashi subunit-like [Tropilaelaps mercedesae]